MKYSRWYVVIVERGEHKGENGKVLIVGGSEEYVGCLALAGMAALRTGVDLVYIAAPERVAWSINAYSPDLITIKLPGDYITKSHVGKLLELSKEMDALLIGTGMGMSESTREVVSNLTRLTLPKVVDADALKVLDVQSVRNAILTPHAGEYKSLFGIAPNRENLVENARPNRIIALKGKIDLISDGTKIIENKTGNSGMTVGGTGDVLAGIITGLLAQGFSLVEAARLGTKICGIAGDKAFEERGYSLIASDLIEKIPLVLKEIKK